MAENASDSEPEVTGAAETTDAGTEGLETISMADGSTENATPDVPPVTEPNPAADSSEGGVEAAKDGAEAAAEAAATADKTPEPSPLDRVLDISIGAVVVAVDAARQGIKQVQENGPEVAKNFAEKGRPIREKLAAQIKERGFGPATLPLVEPDGTDPTAPPTSPVAPEVTGSSETVVAETTEAAVPPAEPVKPAVVLPPGSSAADQISLLERRVREMEQEVEPLDPSRLTGDHSGDEDSEVSANETPAESATYVPNELNEADAELEAVPQFIDSPYAVSENEAEQSRESDADLANGRDFDRPSPSGNETA